MMKSADDPGRAGAIVSLVILAFGLLQNIHAWHSFNKVESASANTVYILVLNKMEWNKANQACQQLDAVLARFDSDYLSKRLNKLITNEWSNHWDTAWFGLHWHLDEASNSSQLVWADTCQTPDSSWTNYQEKNDKHFTSDPSSRCVGIDSETHEWTRRPCNASLNFICERLNFTTTYDVSDGKYIRQLGIDFISAAVANATSLECKRLCETVYLCYMTSWVGTSECILGIATKEGSTYLKKKRYEGQIHEFTQEDILSMPEVNASVDSNIPLTCQRAPQYMPANLIDPQNVTELSWGTFENTCQASATVTVTQTIVKTVIVSPTPLVMPTTTISSTITPTTTISTSSLPAASLDALMQQVEIERQAILRKLNIDTRSTSKSLARRSCAENRQSSAKAIGYLAIIFISLVVLLIVISDALRLVEGLKAKLARRGVAM